MTDEHFQRVEKLFLAAHNLAPDERTGYLDSACADDASLRAEVEDLLAQDADPHELIRTLAFGKGVQRAAEKAIDEVAASVPDPSTSPESALGEQLLDQVGPYRIIRVLGQGGMGVVYEAEQEKPRRIVALKVIRPGVVTQELLRRFEHEAQVLGRLQHPGIAQIYEAGTYEIAPSGDRERTNQNFAGMVPYFAMEYIVNAKPITDYAKEKNLDPRASLQLLADVCDAVQHAHQKGVIHRDLKPGNILVNEAGQPKILDFGVARATDSDIQMTTMQTDIGQLIGTIQYMSPEQAAGDPRELDTRSDVYALGVIMYELLAGRLPYDIRRLMIHEAVRVIREDDPTPLSSVNRVFRGDVETIVAKALVKEKDRRYQAASDLANDVRRYLSDEPIAARPASAMYQFRKFARRNKALVVGVVAVFIVLVAGIVATSTALSREAKQRRIAETARAEVQEGVDELKTVTEFQQSMLSDIDVEEMGRGILADQRERIRERLESESASGEEIEAALASFDELVRKINPTDLAQEIVDEYVLSRAIETIEKEFADQPLVEAALRQTVAGTYRDLGMYPQAIHQQERALDNRRHGLGDDHPDTLTSINNMGAVLEKMGKLAEAEPYTREALEARRRVLGDDHPDTLRSIGNMGSLLEKMGKFVEAEPYYREALDGYRRVLGDDHPDTLGTIGNMGGLLQSMRKFDEALSYYREALDGYRRVLGDDHLNTLGTIHNMGSLLKSMGKLAEAEQYTREALEGARRVLGDDHPDTLTSMHGLALLYVRQGRYSEAEPLLMKVLKVRRRVLGEEHSNTAKSMMWVAWLLGKQGKHEQAEPFVIQALQVRRRVLGEEHPDTLSSMRNLAMLYKSQGRYDEAEPLAVKALEISRRVLGEEHPDTLHAIYTVGALLHGQGKLAEAEPYFRYALEGCRRVLGDEHPATLMSMGGLASLSQAQGKLAEAEALFREVLDVRRRTRPEGNPEIGSALVTLGLHLVEQNKYAEAEPLVRECLEIRRKGLPEDHWLIFTTMTVLGASLAGQGKFAQAATLLVDGYAGMMDHPEATDVRRREALERIVKLYDTWHSAEPDKGYDAKAAEWRAKLPQPADEPEAAKP